MPWIEVAGDICLRRPRSTQGCRPNDDDDDDDDDDGGGGGGDDDDDNLLKIKSHIMKM
jgi:hypothetical protein